MLPSPGHPVAVAGLDWASGMHDLSYSLAGDGPLRARA